ncbi:choice-of-anchor D domain-containing protein [Flavobacterium sp.]|uniref:choice-of-anchor D domain-containing protein n=1 Tax=Flavobacterium sp. TaxID=239 RepID=UPI003527108B
MKTKLLFLALLMSVFSWGQILTFDFDGYAGNEATGTSNFNNPNLTTSTISRGAGLTAAGNLNRFNATSWALTNIANAVSGNHYMEFTITPNSGYQFSVSSIFVQLQRSSTGPSAIALRSSLDGYTSNLDAEYAITDNTSTQTFTFTFAQPNSTTAVTYRMYMYAEFTPGSGGPGDGAGNDIVVNGTVTSTVPMAPVITSDLNASAFVGVPFSYTILADNTPTSFNATGLPPGFSIDTVTGVITGTPGATGTFFVTITATNGTGFDEQTLILTVTNPGPEINIRGASGGTNNIINGNTIPNAFNNTLYASIAVGANQDKDFRIENLGISNLTLTGVPRVQITGTHAADFTVTTQPAASIVSGANSVFVIRFSPSAGGVRNATVTIINNDSDEAPYTFAIQGGGLAPDINIVGNGNQVLSGSTIPDLNNHTNFGNANVTAGTKLRNFFIINLGGDVLDITSVTITGTHATDFTVTTTPSASVGLNSSTTLGITFDPSALGLREALVTVNNNVPGKSPFTFAISGVGIDFDECIIGGSSIFKTQTFEGAVGTNVLGYTVSTALGANPPVITGGTAFGGSRTVVSNKFLNNNSLQVTGPYPSTFDPKAKVIVTFDVVDTSIYQDVSFYVNIGAYSTNGTQGLDVSDWVTISVSGDGGATWSREAIVKGNSNAIWNVFGGGTTFTNPFKGLDIPYEVQPTANSVANGTRLLTLTNLPQVTQLQVKIELDVDRNDEVWVIDNVQLRGRLPVPKTWNGVAWSGDGLPPTSVEKAIFAGNYNTNIHGDVTACECQINSPRIVTITDGNYIQSAGKIVNNGTLNVQNNGSLVQLDDYAANTGNINLTRTANIRRLDYVYWSSPVASFPVLNISPSTPAAVVFKWLPTIAGNFGNWTNANEDMVQGKGYIVRGPSSFNNTIQPYNAAFIGVPNNGIFTPSIERGSYTGAGYPSPTNPAITVTANDDNFNLLGNPYPSAIRALDFLTENTNIEGSVRIWTHGLLPNAAFNDPFYNDFAYNYNPNDYIVHNGTGTVSGPLGFNGFIASGQGFFVLMNDGAAASETVTFKNSMRNVTHANNQFFRQSDQIQGEQDFKIWLDFIPENGNPVRTLVGYVEGATNEKDRLFDASTKVDGTSKMYSLIDNKPFIIQGRALPFDQNDLVPMGYNTSTAGRFTIAIADVIGLGDKKIYLEDKLLNIIHDLTVAPYVFDSNVGIFDTRFELRFSNETLTNPDFNAITASVIAFVSNGQLHVKSTLEKITHVAVYDVLGRLLYTQSNQPTNEFASTVNFSNQTVIVQIKLENNQIITKKLIL